jgi:hypothetical protein
VTFTARYPGHCAQAGCYEPVEPGQEVEFVPGSRDLVHAVCPDAVPEVVRPVCPRCFLELPLAGVCGACE